MKIYEGMYILSATLSEGARKKALDKITEGITDSGGEIKKTHDLGKKKFAYSIKRKQEGYYYLVYFMIEGKKLKELHKEYQLHEDLIRFLIMEVDEVKETIEFKSLKKG